VGREWEVDIEDKYRNTEREMNIFRVPEVRFGADWAVLSDGFVSGV